MIFRLPPEVIVMLLPVLLFALVFHEFSHAWVANKLGDPICWPFDIESHGSFRFVWIPYDFVCGFWVGKTGSS